jgi:hypothetical protein
MMKIVYMNSRVFIHFLFRENVKKDENANTPSHSGGGIHFLQVSSDFLHFRTAITIFITRPVSRV